VDCNAPMMGRGLGSKRKASRNVRQESLGKALYLRPPDGRKIRGLKKKELPQSGGETNSEGGERDLNQGHLRNH